MVSGGKGQTILTESSEEGPVERRLQNRLKMHASYSLYA